MRWYPEWNNYAVEVLVYIRDAPTPCPAPHINLATGYTCTLYIRSTFDPLMQIVVIVVNKCPPPLAAVCHVVDFTQKSLPRMYLSTSLDTGQTLWIFITWFIVNFKTGPDDAFSMQLFDNLKGGGNIYIHFAIINWQYLIHIGRIHVSVLMIYRK